MSTSFFYGYLSIYRPRKVFTNLWVEKKVLQLFASQNLRSTVSWSGLATSVLGMGLLFLPASKPGAKCYVIVSRITGIILGCSEVLCKAWPSYFRTENEA